MNEKISLRDFRDLKNFMIFFKDSDICQDFEVFRNLVDFSCFIGPSRFFPQYFRAFLINHRDFSRYLDIFSKYFGIYLYFEFFFKFYKRVQIFYSERGTHMPFQPFEIILHSLIQLQDSKIVNTIILHDLKLYCLVRYTYVQLQNRYFIITSFSV